MPIDPSTGADSTAAASLNGSGGPAGGPPPGEAEPIHIPSDLLPPGIKEGDTLKCTGMDDNGAAFELEKGAPEGASEDKWADDFRKDMSPANPTSEAS